MTHNLVQLPHAIEGDFADGVRRGVLRPVDNWPRLFPLEELRRLRQNGPARILADGHSNFLAVLGESCRNADRFPVYWYAARSERGIHGHRSSILLLLIDRPSSQGTSHFDKHFFIWYFAVGPRTHPVTGSTGRTFDRCIGISLFTVPPGNVSVFFTCFLTRLRPATVTFPSRFITCTDVSGRKREREKNHSTSAECTPGSASHFPAASVVESLA